MEHIICLIISYVWKDPLDMSIMQFIFHLSYVESKQNSIPLRKGTKHFQGEEWTWKLLPLAFELSSLMGW